MAGGLGWLSSILFLQDIDHCVLWKNEDCENGPDLVGMRLEEITGDLSVYDGWNDEVLLYILYFKVRMQSLSHPLLRRTNEDAI